MGDGALCHDCKRYKCICNDPVALAQKQAGIAEVLAVHHAGTLVVGEGLKRDEPRHYGHTLVALEGLDACGKGTQTALLVKTLDDGPVRCTALKFPYYDNRSGREIIKAFNNPHHDTTLAAYSLQALQTVNRLEERKRLWDALHDGHLVLDRYTASALAYGMADGLPFDWLMAITPGDIPIPDYQIYIDIDVTDSFIRRPERADAYEANRERLEHVRRMYLGLFGNPPKTVSYSGKETAWLVVDGRGTIDEVHQRILACLR